MKRGPALIALVVAQIAWIAAAQVQKIDVKPNSIGKPTPTAAPSRPFAPPRAVAPTASRIQAEDATTPCEKDVPLRARFADQWGVYRGGKGLYIHKIGPRVYGGTFGSPSGITRDDGWASITGGYFKTDDQYWPSWPPSGRYAVEWSFPGDAQALPARAVSYLTITDARTALKGTVYPDRVDNKPVLVVAGKLVSVETGKGICRKKVKITWANQISAGPTATPVIANTSLSDSSHDAGAFSARFPWHWAVAPAPIGLPPVAPLPEHYTFKVEFEAQPGYLRSVLVLSR